MPKKIQKRFNIIKLFLISIFSFIFSSCEEITLDNISETSNDDNSGSASCSDADHCKIFVTNSTYTGNLGGVSGADSNCMTDSNYPGTGTYKALITSSTRTADPGSQQDWVLQASKEYRRLDNTIIGSSTSASILDLDGGLSNSIFSTYVFTWSGLESTWASAPNNCQDWSSDSTGNFGIYGYAIAIYGEAINYGFYSCEKTNHIICVEQ